MFLCDKMLKTSQELHVDDDVCFSVGQLNKVGWIRGKPWRGKKRKKEEETRKARKKMKSKGLDSKMKKMSLLDVFIVRFAADSSAVLSFRDGCWIACLPWWWSIGKITSCGRFHTLCTWSDRVARLTCCLYASRRRMIGRMGKGRGGSFCWMAFLCSV